MVESVYGRMNELFKLSARMKNATNLEKCTWMKTVMAVVSLECTGLLSLSYTVPDWAEQKHSSHGDKCSYSVTFLHSTLIHDIVITNTKIDIPF